jgi:DNA repair protein RecO (recombination protein O)
MEWSDEGIVLAVRRHGESGAILTLLTQAHGRHAGLVRGGGGARSRGLYEPGNRVLATWRARLAEHLGHFTCEVIEAHAAPLLDDPLRLAALAAAAAVADAALPERESHPAVYERLKGFLSELAGVSAVARPPALTLALEGGGDAVASIVPEKPSPLEGEGRVGARAADSVPEWQTAYVRWELALLADLGFGLDLASCAATGLTHDLAYVSPRSGRAVSADAGEPYADRLLRLPYFLLSPESPATPVDILRGLDLTGYFLRRHVFVHRLEGKAGNGEEPAARGRFLSRLRREAGTG